MLQNRFYRLLSDTEVLFFRNVLKTEILISGGLALKFTKQWTFMFITDVYAVGLHSEIRLRWISEMSI